MSKDFRTSQIQTSKLIASGGISGTTVGLAIYSGSISTNIEGGVSDAAIFNDVGTDVFLFVSGSKNLTNFDRENVTLFGGDIVVSGTLYAERQVIEVDGLVDGDMIVTGSLFVKPDANSSNSVVFRQADGTNIFVVDSTTPMIQITGSVQQTGDLSLMANSYLRFNNPDTPSDQFIYGDGSVIYLDADNYFFLDYDTSSIFRRGGFEQLELGTWGAIFNDASNVSFDFRVESDALQGAILVDSGDNTITLGSNVTTFAGLPSAAKGSDVAIILSGTAGTKDSSTRGVVLLPGDVVISGSLYGGSPLKISSDIGLTGSARFKEQSAPSVGSNEAVLYAKDDSGVTKLFMKQSDGAEFGPLGTGGSLDDSYDTPPGGGARSSGSGRFITADGGPVQIDISGVSNTQGALAITGSTVTTTTTDTLMTFIKENSPSIDVLNTTFASKNRNFLITNHVPDSVSANEGSIILNPDNNKGVVSLGNNSDSSYLMFRGNTSKNGASGYIASYNGAGGSESANVGIYIQGLGGVSETGVVINEETGRGSPDFRVRGGTNKAGAILVDWGDQTVVLGSNVTTFAGLPSEAKGADVSIVLSGSAGTKDSSTRGVVLVPGDMVISGTLYGGSPLKVSGGSEITGSLRIDGDLNLETGHRIYLNANNDNDISIRADSNTLTIDGDDNISLIADTQIQLDGSTNNVLVNATKFHINTSQTDVDTIINTNNYVAFYADGNDETIIIGNQELFVPDPLNPGFNIADTPSQITGYGNDVKVLIDGQSSTKDSSTRGVTLLKGDVVISGSLYDGSGNEIGGGSVDVDWTDGGNKLFTTSSVSIDSDSNYAENYGTDIFFYVSGSQGGKGNQGTSVFGGDVVISGSTYHDSDISMLANSRIRFNNPGENDQYIYGNNSNIIMETDNYLNVYADTSVNFDVNNGSSRNYVQFSYNSTNFNTQRNPTNFRVDTDNYYGTFFIDGTDETIIIGNENFDSTPAASEVAGYGNDVKIMLSGTIGSKDSSTRGVVLIPGDIVVSGSAYYESSIQAAGNISMLANSRLQFNNPGENDQWIYGNNSTIYVDADNYINFDYDIAVNFSRLGTEHLELGIAGFIFNDTGFAAIDFRVESDTLQGAILVDSGDNTITLGSNVTTFASLPSDAKGADVKILLSGSAGSKDSSTRGVTLISGDTMISGSAYFGSTGVFEAGIHEHYLSLVNATSTVNHDCNTGHIFYHSSITSDFTANFINLNLSQNYATTLTLILSQGATAYIPDAVQIGGSGQTIDWQGGSEPVGTPNGKDVVSFTIINNGGSYIVLGQLVDFG